jgi:hypothetical protein
VKDFPRSGSVKMKMDMLRHDHITDNYKLMALSDLFHDFEEEIATVGCTEKGTALIATCGNKVGVPSAVVAVQVCRHENDVTGMRGFSC